MTELIGTGPFEKPSIPQAEVAHYADGVKDIFTSRHRFGPLYLEQQILESTLRAYRLSQKSIQHPLNQSVFNANK
ncbi:hypothetical protein A2154_04675 [Candidatus Gottesmanbacteria bacterium RBG_16_43_7]|uniref:Uncharacterized protein n=1 Tax=Candidatus Gottesmanbacteria bacterium RBG_16_43_7 TaxID=1798373 RepID=A0A1F5Z7P8_9BACT|nr:MAG: hypothetical protein A2154_04675 [Candidatus Gottesmanbacteria bacterium RBG_16_43_7]